MGLKQYSSRTLKILHLDDTTNPITISTDISWPLGHPFLLSLTSETTTTTAQSYPLHAQLSLHCGVGLTDVVQLCRAASPPLISDWRRDRRDGLWWPVAHPPAAAAPPQEAVAPQLSMCCCRRRDHCSCWCHRTGGCSEPLQRHKHSGGAGKLKIAFSSCTNTHRHNGVPELELVLLDNEMDFAFTRTCSPKTPTHMAMFKTARGERGREGGRERKTGRETDRGALGQRERWQGKHVNHP